ncbi:La protein like protein [Eufriesea mexicana]|uniref:La protein like protein n=1 Tax=Eufriesea mexicana TaxID=516756 RepID=A0A310S9Y5_9HYME|nr:PREDICTED: la protein homolog [Eufriesea mexicana]OAD55778.1 La protein like protein [Eufriesea mexicana]
MENGQEETKVETVTNDAVDDEVKNEKPVSNVEENATKQISEEPSNELLERIKTQIEFYFGDVNMQRDKFLIEQTKLDDGWVPMTVMLNFKMLASMSQDTDVILKAIESSELMEISEDKKKIRRSPKHPLPVYNEEYRKAQEARTAYVKGFPLQDTNIEKLKAFFNDYEPFENIVMRKYQDKEKKLQFKGSIFIQFKTLENAKAFMARESIKYGDTELIRKWSADYSVDKAKEKEDRRQKRSEMKAKKSESGKEKDDKSGDENESEKDSVLPKGCVIHFSDIPDKCTREDIKDRLGELDASIAFIDFKIGDKEGWVRLQGENTAKAIIDKMSESKVLLRNKLVTCRVLEGQEEKNYLIMAEEQMANSRTKHIKGKKGKKGRNTQRGQRKRRNSETNDSVAAKKMSVD